MLSDVLRHRVSRRLVGKCGAGLLVTAVRLHISVAYLTQSGLSVSHRLLVITPA